MDELLAADDVDIVVNLTVPNAHYDVTLAALSAGKHVYTEKPLATNAQLGGKLVEAAAERNLALASAPDTFMGAAGRRARRLIDEGAIGRPVTGTAFMFGHGMEHWHPNPHFYYQPGGGPVLDMGPYYLTMLVNLLGPAKRVVGMSAIGAGERIVTAEGPSKGSRIPVGTPTTVMSVLEFAGGATVTVGMSWDVWRHGNPNIELHGTEGSLRLPDPDAYGGLVELSSGGAEWRQFSTENDKVRRDQLAFRCSAPGELPHARRRRDGRRPAGRPHSASVGRAGAACPGDPRGHAAIGRGRRGYHLAEERGSTLRSLGSRCRCTGRGIAEAAVFPAGQSNSERQPHCSASRRHSLQDTTASAVPMPRNEAAATAWPRVTAASSAQFSCSA